MREIGGGPPEPLKWGWWQRALDTTQQVLVLILALSGPLLLVLFFAMREDCKDDSTYWFCHFFYERNEP